jgi:hypothetical protein
VLVLLLEFSGVQAVFADYLQSTQEQADGGVATEAPLMLEALSASSSFAFVLFLVGSVFPAALVISYVRSIFAGEGRAVAKVYSQALPLWIKMIGLYCITWGGVVLVGMSIIMLFSVMGLANTSLSSLFMTGFIGGCIYLHHRLSLAPYFCAQGRIGLIQALKASWQYAQPVVLVLMLGNFLVHVVVVVLLSGVGNVLQGFLPLGMSQSVDIVISVIASLAAVLQVIFVYRVFAFVTEKHEGPHSGSGQDTDPASNE